ncbi:MAG TPA: ATP-binding protein [Steroidobacteraceae bacterium]|nr:ATP-binding protein [Steroidobacteraceae bacterium]
MPRTIALIYLSVGAVWIFFSDRLLVWLRLDPAVVLWLQTAKGWLFVIGSAVLLFVAARRYERRGRDALAALIESRNEVRRANADLERRVAERTRQLEAANRELEAFAYAVSHDLRAPLRSMSGFSQILQESAPPGLDDKSRHYLQRIHDASVRMSSLIEDLLNLSRIGRSELTARPISLSQIAGEAAAAIRERHPAREVQLDIASGLEVSADPRLLRIALENLLSNAWKYTARTTPARVSIGKQTAESGVVYFVRDNGVGFDMKYADKLFVPFQRLHPEAEFPGSGIGLVTVQRIIARHGGRIWADAKPDEGATFYFTL